MTHRNLVGAALLAGAVLAPAGSALAQAPPATLTTSAPCFIARSPMAVVGAGFTPGANWNIKTTETSNQIFEFGQADPVGAFVAAPTAPSLGAMIGPGSKEFTLLGTERAAGGMEVERARTTFRVANFAAAVTPTRGRPQSRGSWKFSGFTPEKSIYVHVRRSKKTLGNFRFGKATGPCGELRKRAKRLPISNRRIRSGRYDLFFDSSRTYSARTRPQVRYSTTVFTTRR